MSKTIENAQTRVEGYNFDIRKRVVEYDDVINKQRETIYAERDKVLRNEDLGDTIREFLNGEIDVLIEAHLGPILDEWDLEGLARAIESMGIQGEDLDPDGLASFRGREGIAEAIKDAAEATLEAKEQEYGVEVWPLVERLVLLRTIDPLWVDHLTELDDFRRGVGLRGYSGIDPIVEFKREAFALWEELRGFIRQQVAATIFRVSIQRQAPPPPPQPMQVPSPEQLAAMRATTPGHVNGNGASQADGAAADPGEAVGAGAARQAAAGAVATAARPAPMPGVAPAGSGASLLPGLGQNRPMRLQHGDQAVSAEGAPAHAAKIGRNEPCWCGSGLKYKRCHGR